MNIDSLLMDPDLQYIAFVFRKQDPKDPENFYQIGTPITGVELRQQISTAARAELITLRTNRDKERLEHACNGSDSC